MELEGSLPTLGPILSQFNPVQRQTSYSLQKFMAQKLRIKLSKVQRKIIEKGLHKGAYYPCLVRM
jgi:hypothetical protein